jgi:glucose-1-phosphate thymidylyltransferase
MGLSTVLFEDPYVDQLRPANLARATSSITVGAYSLDTLLAETDLDVIHAVRPHLEGLLRRCELEPLQALDGPVLFLNAGLVPDLATLERILAFAERGEPFVAVNGQRVTAALSKRDLPEAPAGRRVSDWLQSWILEQRLTLIENEFPLLEYAFDIIRWHEKLLPAHLARLVERHRYEHLGDHVYSGAGCSIPKQVAFDTADGPIVLGNGVRIKPFSFLQGPVRIGDRALINDHAAVKHASVIGHTCKIGGETEIVVIEPYSNKQHHGFLGHAWVGSWVNLGAGTSNSDLKNTYGDVSIEYENRSVPTGLQFVGCTIGDFTKSAINTSIFTGKQIGVASFLYGFVTTNVPSFTNYARSFGQVTEVGQDVAFKTQLRAARRRNVTADAVDEALFDAMFELTRSERQLSNEQVTL